TYAPGNDKADETQVTHMNDSWNLVDYTFADFSPYTYGFNTTDFVVDPDPFEIED
ncbi:MAG: hypothetical protein GWN41_09100, partial [Phycisphaerae bacterium]|nr:hypothetical protein [Phycisphaerae bacterium]